jgi:hypothetical protein
MSKAPSTRELLRSLQEDTWRKTNPLSPDIVRANEVILYPYASESEKARALALWMQHNQLCLFGRVAAARGRIHFCILSDDDLHESDQHIRQKIRRERRTWKQGCLYNEKPAHGFLLLAASERVLFAAPDEPLMRFARHLRTLWGCAVDVDEYGNDIAWETLFLQNPDTQQYVRFTFSLDYFGAQGDGRWWHDHRIPGGIGFTANSVGHMARVNQWYEGRKPQIEWTLRTAMQTVGEAAVTKWDKAIWLETITESKPSEMGKCPFQDLSYLGVKLRDKDWRHYAGRLSTDHSIRKELFRLAPEPPPDIALKWQQDLTYLYDVAERDHGKFMEGELISEEEVFQELGRPETWRVRPLAAATTEVKRTKNQKRRISRLLSGMKKSWALKGARLRALMS